MKTRLIAMLACSGLGLWAACSSDGASDADATAAGEGALDDGGAAGAGSGGRLGGGAGGGSGAGGQGGGAAVSGSGGQAGGAGASGSGGQAGGAGVSGSGGGGSGGSSIGPACPGVEPRADTPGVTCRSLEDCRVGFCSEEPLSGCGACMLPQRECETHDDCAGGNRCVNGTIAPCSCTATPSSACVPACTADSCPDGERCGDGVCEPTPCDEGFDCGDGHVCAPERRTADVHGCAPFNCNEGYECEPGFECDTPSGDCHAVHCRAGGDAVCPTNQVCDDGVAGRGCIAKPCRADGDCDCGACINRCSGVGCPPGECHDRLWVCSNLPP